MAMKFQFTNADHTQVRVDLEEGDTFENLIGPTTAFIGMSPGNREFDALFPDADAVVDNQSGAVTIKDLGAAAHPVDAFVKPPEAPIVVAKVDIYRRMTDKEFTDMQTGVSQQTPKIQGIFNAAVNFRSDAPEWALLNTMALQLFGADRAKELLAPTTE